MIRTRRARLVASIAAMGLLLTACGGDGGAAEAEADDAGTADDGGDEPTDDGAPDDGDGGSASADWDALVAAAQEEGEVSIYTTQDPAFYETIGAYFQDEYGITINVFRDIDATVAQRIESELQTGSPTVDIGVLATPQFVRDYAERDLLTPPVGPEFASDDYADELQYGDYFEVSAFVTGLAWNTDLVPDGLEGYEDALDEEFRGRIGIVEPAAPSLVDYWLWLEETYGEDYVDQLAELEPRVYNSALTLNEALIAGEIAVSTYSNPPGLLDAQGNGAPVEVLVPEGVWGAHFYGFVFDEAPNPNAAQLLANHLVTPEGQEVITRGIGSVRTDTDVALAYNPDVRYLDEERLTDDFVREYQDEWRNTFQ
ncbi:extracellular solute-binding protein [Nitriliruptoraceae bacterium ZYF776]|nr:extracellular solute-binding protein [Profundirhabdus halotolerans]